MSGKASNRNSMLYLLLGMLLVAALASCGRGGGGGTPGPSGDGGTGGGGGGATAPTDTTAPSVPQNLAAATTYANRIDLSWDASTDDVGVKEYDVYDGSGSWIATVTATTYSHTSLTAGTTYCYTMEAFDTSNNPSGKTSQVCAKPWEWTSSVIDPGPDGWSDISLAVDSADNPHVGFINSLEVKYATNTSGPWIANSIEPGIGVSLAMDSSDNAHILYFTNAVNDLKYATNSSGSWVINSVGDTGYNASIAVEPASGTAHIVYYSGGIWYATNSSGAWVTEYVDSGGILGRNSIALDSGNNAHISYSENDVLKYATNASGSWIVNTAAISEYTGSGEIRHSDIAVDSNDKVHICYHDDWGVFKIKYATNATGTWTTADAITGVGSNVMNCSIALDSNDKAHVVTKSMWDYILYGTNASGSWLKLSSGMGKGLYPSIAIDSVDRVHIAFYDSSNDILEYWVK